MALLASSVSHVRPSREPAHVRYRCASWATIFALVISAPAAVPAAAAFQETAPIYTLTGPVKGTFYVNPDGTAAKTLTHYFKLRQDGVAITSTLPAWSVSAVSGNITMVISKGGAVDFRTMTTPTARIRVQAVYLGQAYEAFDDITASGLSTTPPTTQTCPDGSVIPATDTCPSPPTPPPPPPTQTCPDGSVIPATETCPPPPPPTDLGSTYFAAFGDMSPLSGGKAVANLTRTRAAEYLLMLGDNCYGTSSIASQIDTNYSAEHTAGKIWPVVGNHDYDDACGGGAAAGYYAYFVLPNNERYYDVVKGPVHLFAINSYKEPDGLTPTSVQGQWLRQKLAASTAPWKIVYFHHAPYSSGSSKGTVTMRWPFEAWGADMVLSGHDHVYERIMLDNDGNGTKIPYIISGLGGKSMSTFGTPTAGSTVRYASAYGALFVSATSTDLKLEFRNVSNVLIDSLTVSKPAAQSSAFQFRTVPKGQSKK